MAAAPATGRIGGWLRRPPWWTVAVVALLSLAVRWGDVAALGHEGRDLQQDVVAAGRLLVGDDLYRPFAVEEVRALGTSGVGITVNAHPPLAAVLVAPLRALPFPATAVAWSAASLAALAAAVWLGARQAGRPALFWVAPALAWWFPVALHVRFGQWSSFLLLAAVVAWVGLEERRPVVAGVALALGGAVKLVPLALLAVPLARRDRAALAWAVGAGLGLVALAELVAPGSLAGFVARSSATAGTYDHSFGNGSLLGWWTRALAGTTWIRPLVDAPWGVWPAWGLSAVAVGVVVARVLRRTDDVGLQLGTVAVAALALSPVTWRHADLLALLPALVLLGRRDLPRRATALALLGGAAALSLVDHWRFARAHQAAGALAPLDGVHQLRSPGTLVLVLVLAACAAAAGPARRSTPVGVDAADVADEAVDGSGRARTTAAPGRLSK